ncbi:MAG: hypothetical protein IPI46_05615 [Bacteroidetes bacterium]|nr:hypothetical protein [Bacteroidota bacterium]
MEFRIAPMIMACLNLILILFVNPDINSSIPLHSVSSYPKILIPFMVIFAMSVGAFLRHSYYSKTFKIVFFSIQALNIALAMYYVYSIWRQHL